MYTDINCNKDYKYYHHRKIVCQSEYICLIAPIPLYFTYPPDTRRRGMVSILTNVSAWSVFSWEAYVLP